VKDFDRSPARGRSVSDDWRAWLPESKAQVFDHQVRRLESSYTMLSISLDEAIELRQMRQTVKSLQIVAVTSDLCKLLTETVSTLLRALSDHARHYGITPNAAPLDPNNFRGPKWQRSARMSSLLSHVLLSQRLQFLHKLSTLDEMVQDLEQDFRHAAGYLLEGTSSDPSKTWAKVDENHYDLNTCLRETIVVLKSFLIALPESQLGTFKDAVRQQFRILESTARQPMVPHRRIGVVAE
jgi:hypothetical protein